MGRSVVDYADESVPPIAINQPDADEGRVRGL